MIGVAGPSAGGLGRDRRRVGAGNASDAIMILVVGDLDRWRAAGREPPFGDDLAFVRPDEVDAALIGRLAPMLVLSPLREAGIDALDVALLLVAAGYRGPFRAVTPYPVPHADLVRSEVAEAAPELDFDVIVAGVRVS